MIRKKVKQIADRYPVRKMVVFTIGCGASLALKMVATNILIKLGLSIQWSYLICLVIVLFFSFFFHSRFTFVSKLTNITAYLKAFVMFFYSVVLLMLIDYFIVVTGTKLLTEHLQTQSALSQLHIQLIASSCILASSVVIFITRFFLYQYVFTRKYN